MTRDVHTLYIQTVDARHSLYGQAFEWDEEKAASNLRKHNVTFYEACEVFFDPFFQLSDAGAEEEVRQAGIGYTERSRLLCVVHMERGGGIIRIISARLASAEERKLYEHE
ncbi:MAG TPA: BrnT family toxin [Candidatus Acidoferrum sp.]|nr:BrnT family toxin [Candidatus Acidoferrum sp.]